MELQIIATGSHLSYEQGETIKLIEEDGFKVDERVEMLLASNSVTSIPRAMGLCAMGISDALNRLRPDMIVVLGDRYELLPICSTALVMNIPICHISGGDVTEGAIDDQVRNAVTMMATIHFPSTEASARNIARMRGSQLNIHIAGEPSLDNFVHSTLMSREELSKNLHLDGRHKWGLVTLHPETKQDFSYNISLAENMIAALSTMTDYQFIITRANADRFGLEINEILGIAEKRHPEQFHMTDTLGQKRYMSYLNQVACVVGNSSSGIVEAPFLGKPVVNIGDRQKGRHLCANVTQVDNDYEQIHNALLHLPDHDIEPDYYYGDGHGAEKIAKTIEEYLCTRQ